jgi:MoxR-like ATPase
MSMKTVSALTTSTSIPTSVRGTVRAYLKGRPAWSSYCAVNQIDSRKAKNWQLLDFAIHYGFDAEVLAIIYGGKPSDYANATAVVATVLKNPIEALGDYDAPLTVPAEVAASDEEIVAAMPVIAEAYEVINVETTQEALAGYADEANVSDILAGVDQFLSPFVRAEIEKALQPLIDAANRPAVTVEVEKIVTVQAMPEAPQGELPYATPGAVVELGKIFGFKGEHSKSPITMWDSHGAAPDMDPHYVVDPFQMRMMATALNVGTNVWLGGPGGSGKSSMPKQFAAFTGRPFVKINFTRQTNVEDLVGGQTLVPGPTPGTMVSQWQDGILVKAMKRPGTVILLDEITLAPAGVQGIIQGCADDHRTIELPTGEKVTCAPGVVFVVADNTFGYGDETGLYHGTNPANGALVNRFGRMLKIDYMPKDREARALSNHCLGCPLPAAEHVVEFVNRARKLPQMENAILSLRNMTAFVRCVQDGFSPKQAAEATMLNRLPATERAALEALFTLTWEGEFVALLSGSQQDVAPRPVGGSNVDHGVFDDEVTASLNR